MSTDRKPRVEMNLVDWMANVWPDRSPRESDTERQIWMAAGCASVVRKMRQIATQQAGTIPNVLDHLND